MKLAECARCGNCCEKMWFTGTKGKLAQQLKDSAVSDAAKKDAAFILKHWHRVAGGGFNTYFSCDQFNAETRLCEAHDTRPPICSDYPWYGAEPGSKKVKLNRRCSFWHDYPREQWGANVDPLPSPVTIRAS